MILTWGMSTELGPISYEAQDNGEMQFFMQGKDYSEKTAEAIDKEIRALCDKAYTLAKDLILSKKTELENVAQALLKYETLDAEDVEKILDGQILDKPTVGDLLAAEQKKTEETEETETQQQD